MYQSEGLRGPAIARRLGISAARVYAALAAKGVPRSRRARLPPDEIRTLYVDAGWSLTRIGERYGVSRDTVARHLRDLGVPIRERVASMQPAGRRPCPKSVTFRAYLLGLVWGDFAVDRHGETGRTLSIRSSSTRPEQVELTRAVFASFGPVTYGGGTLRASLDLTFEFLSQKYSRIVPDWIDASPASRAAFAAGYIDAEGSFGVYGGRGRFKLDSTDESVHSWLQRWCRDIGVAAKAARLAQQGDSRRDARPHRWDLWRITVNEQLSLLRLVSTLDPFSRHRARRANMEMVRRNVLERLRSRDPAATHPQRVDRGSC